MALNNSQYEIIMREYERKQSDQRLLQESRVDEIYSKLPEYRALENEASDAAMEYARATLFESAENGSLTLDSLRERIRSLTEKKAALLLSNGYPADYLKPVYTCPACKDTGYIGTEKCHCFKQAMVELIYSQSNIKDILRSENFKSFNSNYYSDADIDPLTGLSSRDLMKTAYNTSLKFIKNFPSGASLLFFGKAGLGKTFLSHCIAEELMKKGYSVLYLSAPDLFDILRKNVLGEKSEDESSYSELVEYTKTCDLLIIDDLGMESVTEFTISQLNICLNERLLKKRSTLISTNLSPGELRETYGERISSRITGLYDICKFYGRDIRMLKKSQPM